MTGKKELGGSDGTVVWYDSAKVMGGNRRTNRGALVSLFSGALGLDLGLEKAGFQPRLALEADAQAIETIKLNRPHLPIIGKRIEGVSSEEILAAAGLKKSDVTVISAGPCCQSFSTAGNRLSLADPRGSLFRHFRRIVADIRPRFFVMENVKGILSAAVQHRPLDQRGAGHPPLTADELLGSALQVVCEELASLKYYVVFGLLNAADYGVPQKRWRVFFIGSRDGEGIALPVPTHRSSDLVETRKTQRPTWLTLRDSVQTVKSRNWTEFSEERKQLFKQIGPGENWRQLPKDLHRKALGAALDSWGGRCGFVRRLSWDEPSPTLTTAPDGRATSLCHPTELRPLSVQEYAALQQFPPKWKFSGSTRQQYMQIGNAVPIGLGNAVGRVLVAAMKKTDRDGLMPTKDARGTVVCGDPELAKRLGNRKKTQLHPARLRTVKDPTAARKWLLDCAGQQALEFA